MRRSCCAHRKKSKKTAYFAGGCFWGLEKMFNKQKGVIQTAVGYMGGKTLRPSYEEICHSNTEHAETVKILYDPKKVSYKSLVMLFMNHRTRDVYDTQSQYRSVVFCIGKHQKAIAQKCIVEQNVEDVQLLNASLYPFYVAEDYHQKYGFQKDCDNIKTENLDVFEKICKNNTTLAEPAGSGKYYDLSYRNGMRKGTYHCSCCNSKLYSSRHAYDSGTGWPAFYKTLSEKNILFDPRTSELRCRACGLHLGHRTFDGPTKTKIHDCINSACLAFSESKSKKKKKHFTKKKYN